MNKALIGLAAAGLVAVGGCASQGPKADARRSDAPVMDKRAMEEHAVVHTASTEDLAYVKSTEPLKAGTAVLYVNGLGCPLCAKNADLQLERVKGVSTVAVDLSTGKVTVGISGKERPSPAQLAHAVEDAGFTLVRVESR